MPDAIFAEAKLAEIYDLLDNPDRPDLVPYLAIADSIHAHSVIDLGCGTGTLACRLAELGFEVVGIDPAAASLSVALKLLRVIGLTVGSMNRIVMKITQSTAVVPTSLLHRPRCHGPRWKLSPCRSRRKVGIT